MRYRYWIDASLGLILIVAPFVGRFAADRPALYTDLTVGILLFVWAIVGYLNPGGLKTQGMRPTHA